jgi:hypothetical protein
VDGINKPAEYSQKEADGCVCSWSLITMEQLIYEKSQNENIDMNVITQKKLKKKLSAVIQVIQIWQ